MKLLADNLNDANLLVAVQEALGLDSLESFVALKGDAFNSEIWRLTLQYATSQSRPVSGNLILKRNRGSDGLYEYRLYDLLRKSGMALDLVPTCYYAGYDNETGLSALLLEDLSHTHRDAVERIPNIKGEATIKQRDWDSILETLANFHAHWWNSTELGRPTSAYPMRSWYNEQAAFDAFIATKRKEFETFQQQLSGNEYDSMVPIIAETLARVPQLWESRLEKRIGALHNITLSQGDCYIGQFLLPRNIELGKTMIVDFQEASANVPAFDLGYLLSFFPPANQKDTLASLRQYHACLPANITVTYPFEMLIDDFRWILCLLVLVPIWDASYQGSNDSYWGPKLRNVMRDFEAFGCLEWLRSL